MHLWPLPVFRCKAEVLLYVTVSWRQTPYGDEICLYAVERFI